MESEQFEEYTKWCAEETDQKEDSIKFNTDRVASLQAQIEQLNGEIARLGLGCNVYHWAPRSPHLPEAVSWPL